MSHVGSRTPDERFYCDAVWDYFANGARTCVGPIPGITEGRPVLCVELWAPRGAEWIALDVASGALEAA